MASELEVTMSSPFVSVVMCTRDRAASLSRVLTSISEMSVPDALRWELVLVDNGSTDATPEVAGSFAEQIPIRRVVEPKPGLSNARNAGVAAALGDYILWTDDDVEVDRNWLAGYVEAFQRFPEGVIFGGRIVPKMEGAPPPWFADNLDLLGDVLAVRDFGHEYLPLQPENGIIPYGANYAIRAAEQRQYPYDPKLGVAPGIRRIGEETSLMRQMFADGRRGYWVPNGAVYHIIPQARQSEKYIRAYYRGHGETSAFGHILRKHRTRTQMICTQGVQSCCHIILFHVLRRLAPPKIWLQTLIKAGFHSGALHYALNYREGDG